MGLKLCWQRIPYGYFQRPTTCLVDGRDEPVAAIFDPFLARPVAAVLEALSNGGRGRDRLDDARADLAHYLAERLGLDEGRVLEALDWATRRAQVEVIPDEIEVRIRAWS